MKSHDPLAPLTDAPPPAVGAKRPSNNLRRLQRKTARGQTLDQSQSNRAKRPPRICRSPHSCRAAFSGAGRLRRPFPAGRRPINPIVWLLAGADSGGARSNTAALWVMRQRRVVGLIFARPGILELRSSAR